VKCCQHLTADPNHPETCFWIHLARSIQGKTEKTWLGSSWFKLWLGSSLVGAMTLFAVAIPFNDDPQQMETVSCFSLRLRDTQQLTSRRMSYLVERCSVSCESSITFTSHNRST
jgi:hypothetical protein